MWEASVLSVMGARDVQPFDKIEKLGRRVASGVSSDTEETDASSRISNKSKSVKTFRKKT